MYELCRTCREYMCPTWLMSYVSRGLLYVFTYVTHNSLLISHMNIHVSDVTHELCVASSLICIHMRHNLLLIPRMNIHIRGLLYVYSYVKHDSCMCPTWLMSRVLLNVYSYVTHNSLRISHMYIHMWNMTHACVRHDLCREFSWMYIHMWHITHYAYLIWIYIYEVSYMYIHMWHITHTCVRRDSWVTCREFSYTCIHTWHITHYSYHVWIYIYEVSYMYIHMWDMTHAYIWGMRVMSICMSHVLYIFVRSYWCIHMSNELCVTRSLICIFICETWLMDIYEEWVMSHVS